jgi:hypothetical protein
MELKDSIVRIPLVLEFQIYEMPYATHFGCMTGYQFQVYGKLKSKL